jgi:SAM-dependent methyltransferase
MTDVSSDVWSQDGYVTEIPYTRSFLRYQTPIAMSFAAQLNGFQAPDFRKPFTYCDLGCGEAVTLLALAEAYPQGTFTGVDMNPDHIGNATALAQDAKLTNIRFIEGTFDDFAVQTGESFDYIAAHGVFSWVSESIAKSMTHAAQARLKDGGLFYFCHYVLPGGVSTETMFHLVQSVLSDEDAPIIERAKNALIELRKLEKAGAPIFNEHPSLRDELKGLERRDVRYLVHEFCNRHFRPKFFKDVVVDLEKIGFFYVGTSRPERFQTKNLLPNGMEGFLEGLPLVDAEISAGLISNEAFRWDVFQKSKPQKANPDPIRTYHIDSAIFPYGFAKEATLWNRSVSFDTDLFRDVIKLAHAGSSRLSDLTDDPTLAAYPPAHLTQQLTDMFASRNFQPLAEQARLPTTDKDRPFRFAGTLALKIFDRDFLAEGFVCFPSRILGSAIILSGFQSLAAIHLQESTIKHACVTAWREVSKLDKATCKKIGVPFNPAEQIKDEEERRFEKQTVPKLVKYGIVAQDLL